MESDKILAEIKTYVKCMSPKHCGCDRCPSCNIFYNRLVKAIKELEKDNDK